MRVILDQEPFIDSAQDVFIRGAWPASWIQHPDERAAESSVTAYRRIFSLAAPQPIRIHVSADERYELFLNGQRLGRGPERGDRHCWFFESYDLALPAGQHVLVARVWWIGADAHSAHAQVTVRPAFLLAAEAVPAELLNTGTACWECKRLDGHTFTHPGIAWGTSAKTEIHGAKYDWDHETGAGAGWVTAQIGARAYSATRTCMGPNNWLLRPALLPAMLEEWRNVGLARHVQSLPAAETPPWPVRAGEHLPVEAEDWNRLLAGTSSLTIPPDTRRRVIVDLGNYYCAYPEVVLTGGTGACVTIRWAESLFETLQADPGAWSARKGNRDEIEGKYFIGVGDTFHHDGGTSRAYEPFWWEAGRYLEVIVTTNTTSLTIERLRLRETHYPYEFVGEFAVPSAELTELVPIARRALEMCSHETYMDCPYYEQMMYVGDTRLEVLTTYALTRDDRLPRKALQLYDLSRGPSGLTQARYPCRVAQYIPPFSLYWIGMVHDFALWRDDAGFVRERLPGVRAVLEAFRPRINQDGLLEALPGWNFVDWVPAWGGAGMPADADFGISGIINWQLVYTLRLAAELEDGFGDAELAQRDRQLANRVAQAVESAFWDDARRLYADDLAHRHFSEHAQCFAILAGDRRTRLDAPSLAQATIYFSHYLFEASRSLGQIERLFDRLRLWSYLREMGFKTTVEMPEPSRSDCHAWGAHPLFHTFASILGIRPASFGFQTVRIEPQLGPLAWARGSLPHPHGMITADVTPTGATIELPTGITGEWIQNGRTHALPPGRSVV